MNEFAGIVSNYKSSVVADVSPPVAALDEVTTNTSQHVLTVKVQYGDATGVAVSSLGTGDLLGDKRRGSRRWRLFRGWISRATGPQRIATYRVDISGFSSIRTRIRSRFRPIGCAMF